MIVDAQFLPALRGDLIELFQLRSSDVSSPYLDWLSNRDVTQYLEVRFAIPRREELVAYVEQCLASPTVALFGIKENTSGQHIGNIKVAWSPNHRVGDIGIMLGDPTHWGRGYGSQAVRVLARFGLEALKLRKLVAGIYRSNVASIRIFESAGFEREAVLRGHALLGQQPEDVLLYAKFEA